MNTPRSSSARTAPSLHSSPRWSSPTSRSSRTREPGGPDGVGQDYARSDGHVCLLRRAPFQGSAFRRRPAACRLRCHLLWNTGRDFRTLEDPVRIEATRLKAKKTRRGTVGAKRKRESLRTVACQRYSQKSYGPLMALAISVSFISFLYTLYLVFI